MQKAGAKAGSGFTVLDMIRIAQAIRGDAARTTVQPSAVRSSAADSTATAASSLAAHGTVSPAALQRQVSA